MDRNFITVLDSPLFRASLSARRAWIEIVDLRKEDEQAKSLSARRAWIEI